MLPLTLAIVLLLTAVFLSYRQTIDAYPKGGGSYTVAKENLGRNAGLVAAAALGLDYVLNVAVGISAGVGAVVSALPSLLPFTLPMCLVVLLVVLIINLRGVRSSGGLFAVPTYLFITALTVIIALGLVRAVMHGGHPHPVVAPPVVVASMTAAAPWLLVRAYANGCTAMTGIEAVSNGVPNFRATSTKRAKRALSGVVSLLALFLVGIAVLCRAYHITAMPQDRRGYESTLSQLAHAVLGSGVPYTLTMASIFVVLCLSANTSFADFPRVARLLASDDFLTQTYGHRGRRLVFSHGILVLGVLSGILLVVFGGVTDRLIPLFAIGALLAFTMSQSGMVVHWHKRNVHGLRLWLNAVGATATGMTVVLVLASKFTEGAWLSVLIFFALIALFVSVRRHRELIERATHTDAPLDFGPPRPPLAIVPVRRWDAVAREALQFAIGFAPEVVAVQVLTDDRVQDDLAQRWHELAEAPQRNAGIEPPKLVVLRSEYRQLFSPLLHFVSDLAEKRPDRQIAVIVPELVEPRWYRAIAHSHTSQVLKALLLYRGGPPIVVVSTPWYLKDWLRKRRTGK
jgi:amino acid transporter